MCVREWEREGKRENVFKSHPKLLKLARVRFKKHNAKIESSSHNTMKDYVTKVLTFTLPSHLPNQPQRGLRTWVTSFPVYVQSDF